MSLLRLVKHVERFAVDNSPLILTSIGVAGTISAAVLTGKAAWQSALILDEVTVSELWHDAYTPPTILDKAKLVWPLYIPPAATLTVTVTAIVMANRIGTKRAAAIAAAYALSEKAFDDYRDKILEKLGPNKEREARDEIAQERVSKNPVGRNEVIITDGGDVLCYDVYTGRYFNSDMETIKQAQNKINHHVINHGYSSLNDFYDAIGLDHIQLGEEVGWNTDEILEIYYSTTMSNNSKPCISIEFRSKPIRNYFRVH